MSQIMVTSLRSKSAAGEATAGRRRNGTIDECSHSLSRAQDQKPSISIVADGTDLFFASFPSTSYLATFARSLRDGFSLTATDEFRLFLCE